MLLGVSILSVSIARGVVVHAQLNLIAWRNSGGVWLGLPVFAQTGPLHRAHVKLASEECRLMGLPARTSIVNTERTPLPIDPVRWVWLGICPASILDRIATTIRRAHASIVFERDHTPAPWLAMHTTTDSLSEL